MSKVHEGLNPEYYENSSSGKRGNPYRKKGKFASANNYDSIIYTPYGVRQRGKRQEYVNEEELKGAQIHNNEDVAKRLNIEEQNRDKRRRAVNKQATINKIQAQIDEWNRVLADPYHSPYLDEQAHKKLAQLKKELEKLQ